MRIFLKKLDTEVYNGEYKVPIRMYFSDEKSMEDSAGDRQENMPVILFFHGGGWTTESVETYDRVCSRMGPVHRAARDFRGVQAGAGAQVPCGV